MDVLLAKSGQTVLIIAHRLSTIKHANQIVVLDKGTVAELGTFDNLMSIKDGIFYRLVEKQTFDWRDDKF
jgi:ABC-type multidrug transport system fused ATPase/permease subunit